ncbi:MAG: magnesium transporter [Desulfurococcales archaeon]|jgi:magnesium transporter|nr:magnesium transporter [Desulfurococcales archaeon]
MPQASALVIRGLVTGEIKLTRIDILAIVIKEILTTITLLLLLAPIGFAIGLIPYIAYKGPAYSAWLAATVTMALITSSYVAEIVGSLLPVALSRPRIDPAVSSAPFITAADILTVTVYFIIATHLFQF